MRSDVSDPIAVPETRRPALERVLAALDAAGRIVLTTHVNADGDGAGSEAALGAWLAARGKSVTIVNPTPFPATYLHLVADPVQVADLGTAQAERALHAAELFAVLDTSEPKRLGRLPRLIDDRPAVVIDHHPPGETRVSGTAVQDPTASATGELVFDLLRLADPGGAWPAVVAEALYTALVTDTGSFRFANTTPRTHAVAAELLLRGVDPEAVYRRLFATVPLRRIELLRAALERLEADPDAHVSWISLPRSILEPLNATSEDLDGIVEYARSIKGTEVAILFRELPDASTKVSWRSNGEVDVNALARKFGGGGHVKAAGALIGQPLDAARRAVLDATRMAVQALERGS
ncbi:MAG TPA: bifunctional oligoribonuclease/PAP phosphatase NrnA [Longimicrobiales bacterium]